MCNRIFRMFSDICGSYRYCGRARYFGGRTRNSAHKPQVPYHTKSCKTRLLQKPVFCVRFRAFKRPDVASESRVGNQKTDQTCQVERGVMDNFVYSVFEFRKVVKIRLASNIYSCTFLPHASRRLSATKFILVYSQR